MSNVFSEIEDKIFYDADENIIFNEDEIKKFITNFISIKLNSALDVERAFVFEQIIYDFFDYMKINIVKTKKTRDFGIDGVIKLKLELLGDADLGLQIKHKLIDSNDIDLFLTALKNSELHFGVLICKDSRKLQKYELNNKIKAILFARGINLKQRLIKDNININPIFIMKFQEIIDIVALDIRYFIKGVYKK